MLIPASNQKAVAEAVNNANEAAKDKQVIEAANFAIPRAREMFEEGIEKSAKEGKHCYARNLGACTDWGCTSSALKERYGKSIPFAYEWNCALKGIEWQMKRGRWRYVHELWSDMCDRFVQDLIDLGYTVCVKGDGCVDRHELSEENLARFVLEVSW